MAKKIRKTKEHELAQTLYVTNGWSAKEIAAKLDVRENTVGKWAKDGNWKILKASITSTPATAIANLFQNIIEIQDEAKEEERSLTSTETNMIAKISKSIELMNPKKNIGVYITTLEEFLLWLKDFDITNAKGFAPLLKDFIQHKIQQINKL